MWKARRFLPSGIALPRRHAGFARESVMSLLDTLGSIFGKSEGGSQQNLVAAVVEYVNNQPGGLNGLIQRFQQNGAGDIVGSWIGKGENQPISADMVQNVLGSDMVSGIAQKAGVSPDQASGLLAQVLPHVIDHATPDGEVPVGGQLDASSILSSLGGAGGLASLAGSLFGGKKDA
jgi:uncharacterized protein YidB (DUF937 family)